MRLKRPPRRPSRLPWSSGQPPGARIPRAWIIQTARYNTADCMRSQGRLQEEPHYDGRDEIDSKLPKRSPLSRRRCAGEPGRFAVEAAIAALHCEALAPKTRTGHSSCALRLPAITSRPSLRLNLCAVLYLL